MGELLGEIGQVFLQRSQLGRERAQGHEDLEEVIGQSERLCRGSRLGRLLRQDGQAAMMRGGQPAQLFLRQPCEARILRMRLPGERRLRQPAAQRFGINDKCRQQSAKDKMVMRQLLSCGCSDGRHPSQDILQE